VGYDGRQESMVDLSRIFRGSVNVVGWNRLQSVSDKVSSRLFASVTIVKV
jgi:hypothetical protein